MELRDYQVRLVDGVREAMRQGKRRVIAYLPCGAGKTLTAAAIVEMVRERGKRVAFLCNRKQLIDQTSRVFFENGIEHGILQAENTRDLWRPVIVGSIQTVRSRGGLPLETDLLILDECHACAGTKAYADLMVGKYCIGLTATPQQKGLGRIHSAIGGPLFETVVVGAQMRDLIATGRLLDAEVWVPSDPDLSGVKVVAGDYQEDSLAQAMDKAPLVGDIVSHWLKLAYGKQTMVFAVNIAHSQHIRDEFRASGVNAVHVDYRMSDDEKTAIYADFRAGNTMVLCNCALLSEGADFPAAQALILARPTKSLVRYIQMFGRVLRPFEGQTHATVLDHSGAALRLGLPWDADPTCLDDGRPHSAPGNGKEKLAPLQKVCPKCKFLKPPSTPICPSCGHESHRPSDVEMQDGQLVPLGKKGKKCSVETLETVGKERTYKQLLWVARHTGKKDGWAYYKYKELWGVYPKWGKSAEGEEPHPALLSWVRSRNIAWDKRRDK